MGAASRTANKQTPASLMRHTARFSRTCRPAACAALPTQGKQIYKKVSGKHRVEYAIDGTLPLSAAVITYLMNNLPFAAQLVNAYQGTKYQAAYLDKTKKRFSGSGESLSGVFTTVLQNEQQTRSLYHGSGTAEVMVWRLRGTALVTFDFEEAGPRAITYRLRCMVFPNSLFVKSILNFSLFRNAIVKVLDETVGYIQDSAVAFQRGEREPIKNYPAFSTPEGRQHIKEFQELLQRTMDEAEATPACRKQPHRIRLCQNQPARSPEAPSVVAHFL